MEPAEQATVRKTYKQKLRPTPAQALDEALWRCRDLYNVALEQRITAYQRRHVSISHEADGWHVAISCADVPVHPLPATRQETAIDLGLESFATLADGQPIFTPRYYRKAEAYLRRCQRRVAWRHKGSHKGSHTGSHRRHKAVALLAKAQQHITRQRRDFHHKEAQQARPSVRCGLP